MVRKILVALALVRSACGAARAESWLVVDQILPGAAASRIVPVFVHIRREGRVRKVGFISSPPWPDACARTGRCAALVPALGMTVDEGPDGRLDAAAAH